jgi:hypothetical protein
MVMGMTHFHGLEACNFMTATIILLILFCGMQEKQTPKAALPLAQMVA